MVLSLESRTVLDFGLGQLRKTLPEEHVVANLTNMTTIVEDASDVDSFVTEQSGSGNDKAIIHGISEGRHGYGHSFVTYPCAASSQYRPKGDN